MMQNEIPPKAPKHGIIYAVDTFLHSIQDVEACAQFIPLGNQLRAEEAKETATKLKKLLPAVASRDDKTRTEAQAELDRLLAKTERLSNSNPASQLENSLFVGLFASYDAFIGKLLKAIFTNKNELFSLIDRVVPFDDVLTATSIEELKAEVLDQFVSDVRRKSYEDQFSSMETLFGMQLKKFPNYPAFIETSQRRHLFTHCEGIVSQQYIKCCKSAGYNFDVEPKVGTKLKLGSGYFFKACDIVREVGFKLAHTLWRKLFSEELKEADKHLSDTIFTLLQNEKWQQSVVLGEFARGQKKVCDREREKIYLVNYCIALRAKGNVDEVTKILQGEDWSDSAPDFKLAKAVLLEDYESACEIMKAIGKKGDLVSEHGYHTWPLFRDFRSNNQFRETYKSIYGYSFLEELKREAEKTQNEVKGGRQDAAALQKSGKSATTVEKREKPNRKKPSKPRAKKQVLKSSRKIAK